MKYIYLACFSFILIGCSWRPNVPPSSSGEVAPEMHTPKVETPLKKPEGARLTEQPLPGKTPQGKTPDTDEMAQELDALINEIMGS